MDYYLNTLRCSRKAELLSGPASICAWGHACYPGFLPPTGHIRSSVLRRLDGDCITAARISSQTPLGPAALFGAASHPPFCIPLPGSCLDTVTPSHGIQVFQLSPGSLGRCLRRGWGGRKGPRPSSTSFKRLPAGAVRGTEFHVCFCLNKGFLLTVRKSLQASKASSDPEQLLPSLPASNLNISAQQRRIPASLHCCQLADIYSITVSTRERNGLFRLNQLNSPPVSHVSWIASAALLWTSSIFIISALRAGRTGPGSTHTGCWGVSASLSSPASISLPLLIPWWCGHAPDLLYAVNPLENWETEYSQRGVIDLSLLFILACPNPQRCSLSAYRKRAGLVPWRMPHAKMIEFWDVPPAPQFDGSGCKALPNGWLWSQGLLRLMQGIHMLKGNDTMFPFLF